MYNICIDIGNTRTKIGILQQQEIVELLLPKKLSTALFEKLLKKYPVQHTLVSCVGTYPKAALAPLIRKTNFVLFNNELPMPIINSYKTPYTLGSDRLAVACAATYLYPKQNVLIINCGTCITMDIVTNKKEYLGGSISPGLTMRYNALHHYTKKLPLLPLATQYILTGNDTASSIHSGVLGGIHYELQGKIMEYQKKYKTLQTILTGGDATLVANLLQVQKIEVVPHLPILGLQACLLWHQ